MMGLSRSRSISWPRPSFSRWNSAIETAAAPAMPAIESARPNAGSVGGPSGSPVRWAKPLIDSTSVPNAGRDAYGPDWPKPVTRNRISPGLSAASTS